MAIGHHGYVNVYVFTIVDVSIFTVITFAVHTDGQDQSCISIAIIESSIIVAHQKPLFAFHDTGYV